MTEPPIEPLAKPSVPRAFDRVAATYDRLTSLNPGYHRHLAASAARLTIRTARPRLLDLCCGTGASTEALRGAFPDASIVGLDASAGMLALARAKPSLRGVRFVEADAVEPGAVVEGPFDGALMAYGIRNLAEPDRALANLRALLAPGASVVFHEYSVADASRARRLLWDAVCWGVIVPGGLLTARDAALYRYLHRSVRDFDGVRAFEERLRRAGFVDVWTGAMDGWQRGIVHSFVARTP